jgi:hypothetical protein
MFLTVLELIADPVPDYWIIATPLTWKDPIFGTLTVPQGFRTDLASIPRAFRNIPFLDPSGVSRRPAAMHDWLYCWRGIGKDNADEFLKQSLIAEGASAAVAAVFYLGVHEFGQASWDSDYGALESRDFDTQVHYDAWRATAP